MSQAAKKIDPEKLVAWFEEAFGDTLRKMNWSGPLKAVARVIESHTKGFFLEGKSPEGIPWKPLASNRPRNIGKGSALPLRNTEILMGSLTSGTHQNHIEKITGTMLEFGTNVEYAATHQYGEEGRRPKRAKAFTIPLTREAVTAGRARNYPGDLFVVWPKGKPHGWLAEEKRGGKKGKGKPKLIFHYLLVSKITVPARPFLGFSTEMIEDIKETLASAAASYINP